MNNKYLAQFIRLLLVVMTILIICFIIYIIISVAYPFAIGLAFAFFLNPLVNWVQEKFKFPRWLAVTTILFLITGIMISILSILISEIIIGTNYLSQSVPNQFQHLIEQVKRVFTETIIPVYDRIITLFYSLDQDHQNTILTYTDTIMAKISTATSVTIQSVLTGISEILLSLPNIATIVLFSVLATFFISKDWYKLVYYYRLWTPDVVAVRTKEVMASLKRAFFGYLFAQLTLISMTCAIVLIGLLFIKVDYPITIAIIIAAVDLLPYLGTGLVFIPWIFYSFFSGQMGLTISLSILYGIVVVQRQIMEPKILADNIGVDPLATLVSLFVGYKLFGIFGLMIGPVLLVFIQTLYQARVFDDLKKFVFKA